MSMPAPGPDRDLDNPYLCDVFSAAFWLVDDEGVERVTALGVLDQVHTYATETGVSFDEPPWREVRSLLRREFPDSPRYRGVPPCPI